jgi:hypothetical protein
MDHIKLIDEIHSKKDVIIKVLDALEKRESADSQTEDDAKSTYRSRPSSGSIRERSSAGIPKRPSSGFSHRSAPIIPIVLEKTDASKAIGAHAKRNESVSQRAFKSVDSWVKKVTPTPKSSRLQHKLDVDSLEKAPKLPTRTENDSSIASDLLMDTVTERKARPMSARTNFSSNSVRFGPNTVNEFHRNRPSSAHVHKRFAN